MAVVGGITPMLGSITSPGGVQVKEPGAGTDNMADLASILQPAIDIARRGEDGTLGTADDVNKVILVTHLQQISLEEELVPLLSGVDIAVAGGSDTLLANNTERLRTGDEAERTYPIATLNADGEPTLIVSTDGEYSYVGRLVVDFDANGVLIANHLNPEVSDAYPTTDQGVQALWGDLESPFAGGTKGAQVRRLTDAIQGVVTEKDSNVFGRTMVFLEGRRNSVRTEETNLGNLTANANLASARQSDPDTVISIKNGGGIRAEIGFIDGDTGALLPPQANPLSGKQEGDISQLDIENALRFNNELTLLTVTAQELKTLMEHAVAATAPGDTPGQFPQVSGIRFSFDPEQPARQADEAGNETQPGTRIRSLAVVDSNGFLLDTVVANGQVVGSPDRTFRVVTLNFLADGGDNYPFVDRNRIDLAQAADAPRTGAATFVPDGTEQDAMAEYLSANFVEVAFRMAETDPDLDERIQNLSQRSDTVLDILPAPLAALNTGIFDGSAAEISTFATDSNRLFVVNGRAKTIDVFDVSNPTNPQPLSPLDVGGAPNSVAAQNGLIAVAVEAGEATNPGRVTFSSSDGTQVADVVVGALPDMVTFTPDGSKVLVANEGEPNADYTVDPEGSVSIIDTTTFEVMTADFTRFNDKAAMLRNRGVRIFGPNASVAQDLEPEYIAVTPDSSTAAVTLQENNAMAMIDIASATVVDIIALGFKDHRQGPPQVQNIPFDNLPILGTTAGGQDILLGGFSGLWFEGVDATTGRYRFLTVPDRGPNPDTLDVDNDGIAERPFALPDYQARVVPFEVNPATGDLLMNDPVFLFRGDGITPITGLSNIPGVDEEPVDLFGNPLAFDAFGGDLEGIIRDPAGDFWMADEYRPAIYHFDGDPDGDGASMLIARYVPQGTAALAGQPVGTYGQETLPAVYANRRANRGFEAIAMNTDEGILYAFIQTPLDNPDSSIRHSDVIRILGIDPADGTPVREYLYLLERNRNRGIEESRVDKIGDAVYDASSGHTFVIERDSGTSATSKKYIFEIDFTGATNLLADGAPMPLAGKTLEQHTADELAQAGIRPVHKRRVLNLPSVGYLAGDKPEGLALLPDNQLAVLNDNDFGLAAGDIPLDGTALLAAEPVVPTLGIISFGAGNRLDASDRDDGINLQNWPVLGMYQPDAITAVTSDGALYWITANEGDARDYDGFSEEIRGDDLTLDPTAFPDAANLQQAAQLGRLRTTSTLGDVDGDGDVERFYAFGARSFSVWDATGNLVWDSSEDFESITAALIPEHFNANNDENDSFDARSDDKGPEPEGVVVGEVSGIPYVFIGLERVGGVMVYDLSDPRLPVFVTYIRTRNFDVLECVDVNSDDACDADDDRANPAAGGLGPEGLTFISAADSPNGSPLLVIANEVSGSTEIVELQLP